MKRRSFFAITVEDWEKVERHRLQLDKGPIEVVPWVPKPKPADATAVLTAASEVIRQARQHINDGIIEGRADPIGYVWAHQPRPALDSLAEKTMKVCAADLGVGRWAQAWARPARPGEAADFGSSPFLGAAVGDVIVLTTAMTPAQVISTAAHEMAHVAGYDELAALEYEAGWTVKL
jgi:hypothetical protein